MTQDAKLLKGPELKLPMVNRWSGCTDRRLGVSFANPNEYFLCDTKNVGVRNAHPNLQKPK